MIYACLSYFDESPACLTRLVESCEGFADYFIAADGAYASFPDAKGHSPDESRIALEDALRASGMPSYTFTPPEPWKGGEVEKRSTMFELARWQGATPADWLLVIDGDMSVHRAEGWREWLESCPWDVAEVRVENVRPDGHVSSTYKRFRSLFRALPGLTVRGMHHLYAHPLEVGWRYLWHTPHGQIADIPCLDLSEEITLRHHFLDRTAERDAASREYYRRRDQLKLERAPTR